MSKKLRAHLIQGVDFEFILSLPNNGTNNLLLFDNSYKEISSSKDFVKIATAGRHKRLSTIYRKHNLSHHSRLGKHFVFTKHSYSFFKVS